jgi:hypothetical protein
MAKYLRVKPLFSSQNGNDRVPGGAHAQALQSPHATAAAGGLRSCAVEDVPAHSPAPRLHTMQNEHTATQHHRSPIPLLIEIIA